MRNFREYPSDDDKHFLLRTNTWTSKPFHHSRTYRNCRNEASFFIVIFRRDSCYLYGTVPLNHPSHFSMNWWQQDFHPNTQLSFVIQQKFVKLHWTNRQRKCFTHFCINLFFAFRVRMCEITMNSSAPKIPNNEEKWSNENINFLFHFDWGNFLLKL